jgi:hypothetical protein
VRTPTTTAAANSSPDHISAINPIRARSWPASTAGAP